jgi:hypothetical protein
VRFDLVQRYGVAVLGAVAVHVAVILALAMSMSFQLSVPEAVEPQIVAVAAPPPPPPDVRTLSPTDAVALMVPRFRPREPLGVNPEARQRFGDPALAVWRYLCNRDSALSDAAQRDCPDAGFGSVDMGVRDPLNRQGDAGIMLGADTSTMSLEEAGVARGWTKKRPPTGQGAMADKTDQINQPRGPELFEDLPSLKGPTEGASVPE